MSEDKETIEQFVERIKGDFKLTFKDLPSQEYSPQLNNIHNSTLKEIAKLHQKRIGIYKAYLGKSEFRQMIGMVSGKISGKIRKQRTHFMMYVLMTLNQNSPKSFEKWTLTAWRELAEHLFGIAPAKNDLLMLLSDNDKNTGKRLTPTGWNPEHAVKLLLIDHEKTVSDIRKHHDDYVKTLHNQSQLLKDKADAAIVGVKEKHAENEKSKGKKPII